MPVPQDILTLVERYRAQRKSYKSDAYNEAQLRNDGLSTREHKFAVQRIIDRIAEHSERAS